MKKLWVFYDRTCAFCVRCRRWLEEQPKFLEMEFLPAGSVEAIRRFPALTWNRTEELVVLSDESGVYRDTDAYIMTLYALCEYREWAERLSQPAWKPLVRVAFDLLSSQRRRFSRWLTSRWIGRGDPALSTDT